MMSDDVGRRGRKSTRRPRAAEVALAVALSAWIGGMAGALESLVRAVQHGHYFNTLSSYLSFVAVPALLYSIVGALVGALSAVLLRLLSGRSSAPAACLEDSVDVAAHLSPPRGARAAPCPSWSLRRRSCGRPRGSAGYGRGR